MHDLFAGVECLFESLLLVLVEGRRKLQAKWARATTVISRLPDRMPHGWAWGLQQGRAELGEAPEKVAGDGEECVGSPVTLGGFEIEVLKRRRVGVDAHGEG